MILFSKDWREQGAKPDFSSDNRSFVEFAVQLQAMGVKNCAFFLALHDQSLKGVDIYKDELDTDTKSRVVRECKINPWYFFRQIARVPAGSGADPEMIRANRAIICMWWCFFARIKVIIIQPRQTGKSIGADFLKVELMNFRNENTLINLFTKDSALLQQNVARVKEILGVLPEWLNMRTKKDSDNKEGVEISALKNAMACHVPRSDPVNAEKVGRGFTSPQHFYDELPFQSYCSVSYPASFLAMSDAMERAKRAGADYGVVITTTAGRKDDRDGGFVYKMCVEACLWNEKLYDCANIEELHDTVKKNHSKGDNMVYARFTHRQLGYSDAWLKERLLGSQGTPDEAARDLLCIWTSGTETSPFTPKTADSIRNSQIAVKHLEITPENYILRWYIEEEDIERVMNSGRFVMGLDTSEANGGDDIGIFIFDTRTLRVVCTAKVNETNIIGFSQWLGDFLIKYKNVILVPERRSTGSSIIDYLLRILPSKGENPFKRIFNMVAHDSDLDSNRFADIRRGRVDESVLVRYRKQFGYATSGAGSTSRSKLYSDTLFKIVKIMDGWFGDEDVINQLLGLVYKNGRIDHKEGGHDDLVVAMLLGYWFVLFGKNHAYYELEPSDIMTSMVDMSKMSPLERMRNTEQQKLRSELKALADRYANERDEVRSSRLEMQMRAIERKLVLEAGEVNTVDELIRKVKEDRKRTVKDRRTVNNVFGTRRFSGSDDSFYSNRVGF
jgi:PHIKZ025